MTIQAQAHPEKRLFISLLTRDISLADAFLDILDNSINAALKSLGLKDGKATEFMELLGKEAKPTFSINIQFDMKHVSIVDNCGGISAEDAKTKVFVFGASDGSHSDDRLSVYGIGLKRAMFKIGNQINMISEHETGGFTLNLPVNEWQSKKEARWTFEIEPRPKSRSGGTQLKVTSLHPAVVARLQNPTFETELVSRITRAYSFFISRIVKIKVNGTEVKREEPKISENSAKDAFEEDGVSVAITAGIGTPRNGDRYESEFAGWNIYCNGRAVIFYDRTPLTGWGVLGFMPSFQPKHRPFTGFVFFTSNDPEKLPWTTTKLGVNPDNLIWQRALHRMADVGKQVTKVLDSRYGDEGTAITISELDDVSGERTSVQPSLSFRVTTFSPPKRPANSHTSIQYKVDKKTLEKVKVAIGNRSLSNSDVGLYTFNYFFQNELPNA